MHEYGLYSSTGLRADCNGQMNVVNFFFFCHFCSSFFEGGSCPPRELLTCWTTLSILIPDNLNPVLVCLGCMLQQKLENCEMCAEKSWDVEVQNGGWCYLDVFGNKQIHLIKAGCPWRFLLLCAHPTLFSAAMGISGYSKGQLGNGCLRCCFTRGSAPAGGDGANLEEGCFTAARYFCHLVKSFSPAISKHRS